MRIAYSLGSLLSINQVQNCAKMIDKTKVDSIWIPETWGMENFSILSNVAQITTKPKIGSSIINIYSRSPAVIAMGAVTVDTLSKGRLILGLGTSSKPIVEEFHGYHFKKPLSRMKEYVEIIRLISSGEKINYSGEFFRLKNFSLLIKPIRNNIPIYLAAINQNMVNLSWEIGDGVIFYLRPINELKSTIQKMQSKNKIDVACQLITSVAKDSEMAIDRVKKTLAFYVSVGSIYRQFLAENGFRQETENIYSEFKKSGFKSNYELVTKKMLDSLTVYGTSEECKKQIGKFIDAGINLPIIQFNPIGDVEESFTEFTNTFSGE